MLTSDGVEGELNLECDDVVDPDPGRFSLSTARLFLFSVFVSFSSILMSFPCRELGGGGFFLRVAGVDCILAFGVVINAGSSSSELDIS